MQERKLLEVLKIFPDVFSDVPERTDLVQCQLKLKDPASYKMAAYKTPDALNPEVEDQITKMLQLELIEESDSEYSSPLVVVKKTDGSIRLCVNYKALNERLRHQYGAAIRTRFYLGRLVVNRYRLLIFGARIIRSRWRTI